MVPDLVYAPHAQLEADHVITTDPPPGTLITTGDQITITLSDGQVPTQEAPDSSP